MHFWEIVAPFVGAWIEMDGKKKLKDIAAVAPFVGAWIEICHRVFSGQIPDVAPFVGAWIEILREICINRKGMSLPSWERGLKYFPDFDLLRIVQVAPFVGAWIEICRTGRLCKAATCRSLRGSVD